MIEFSKRFPGTSTTGALLCLAMMFELTIRVAPISGTHLAAAAMVLLSSFLFALPSLLVIGSPDELPQP